VDNHSSDGTVEIIEEGYLNYVTLIKNNRNKGFAKANNQAYARAQGKYILFLNPDTQIYRGSLDEMLDWMDHHEDVALAGCRLVRPLVVNFRAEGVQSAFFEITPQRFPRPFPTICGSFKISAFYPFIEKLHCHPEINYTRVQQVDHFRGCFMMARKAVLDGLGYAFDPGYFILYEEIDLCRQVKQLGYVVVYYPGVICLDHYKRSFSKRHPLWVFFQNARSLNRYFAKWHGCFYLVLLQFGHLIGLFMTTSKLLFNKICNIK
jgi:GT2 family glycosyltransferase